MSTVLAAFGAGDDGEQLYRRILRFEGQRLDQHAAALEWEPARAEAAQGPLLATRLVRQDADGSLGADHPRNAITRLVDREGARLDLRRRELDDVRAAVSDFAAERRPGAGGPIAASVIEVLQPDVEVTAVEELLRTTTGVLRATHLGVGAGPVTDPAVHRLTRRQMADGRELRSIYPAAVLEDDVQLAWVGSWRTAGERQRIVARVAHEFVVFGDEAVIAPPHWGATDGGTVVIRLPMIVAAFTRLFDVTWDGALGVPDATGAEDAGARLLSLLAAGYKDEAIARHLGIGVRTVRRRVAEVMDELGACTRFQLGVAAERRELLGRARR